MWDQRLWCVLVVHFTKKLCCTDLLVKLPVPAGTGVALVAAAQKSLASCQSMGSCTFAHT